MREAHAISLHSYKMNRNSVFKIIIFYLNWGIKFNNAQEVLSFSPLEKSALNKMSIE